MISEKDERVYPIILNVVFIAILFIELPLKYKSFSEFKNIEQLSIIFFWEKQKRIPFKLFFKQLILVMRLSVTQTVIFL